MAQLVKLADYVSRYEIDIHRYPSRFVRLKRERWDRLYQDWEAVRRGDGELAQHYRKPGEGWKEKARSLFSRRKTQEEVELPDDWQLRNKSLPELKKQFQDELFSFQLSWASSTVSEISAVDEHYQKDPLLRLFVSALPDTCFLFYEPTLYARKAPVDCDVILLTPNEIWIIHTLSGSEDTIYSRIDQRHWEKREGESRKNMLSPLLSLKRTASVVTTILEEKDITYPVKTAVMTLDAFLDVPRSGRQVRYVDRRERESFMGYFEKMQAPIKSGQLKAAEALLDHAATISRRRPGQEDGSDVENPSEVE
ncbi:nuclease-related domain-containing protein [Alkalicoccus urumqiensis]|uniref:NERD domain-containing protein n=1 Tax=Alkalicoccus urumqiensis TaxID=1548213 RepID=A0A2P6MGG4_ALKUR|nr:nuclease-related domain-containing protein [Alkalicoccus urumqiensis]PRO65385.1 hypothetical protein C6I21_09485 [Alkalicoccus urumqiensis]